ncbi:hypothetical protein GCM10023192_31050 [Amycolatopsis samaneae]
MEVVLGGGERRGQRERQGSEGRLGRADQHVLQTRVKHRGRIGLRFRGGGGWCGKGGTGQSGGDQKRTTSHLKVLLSRLGVAPDSSGGGWVSSGYPVG